MAASTSALRSRETEADSKDALSDLTFPDFNPKKPRLTKTFPAKTSRVAPTEIDELQPNRRLPSLRPNSPRGPWHPATNQRPLFLAWPAAEPTPRFMSSSSVKSQRRIESVKSPLDTETWLRRVIG
ncbi:hypothetical protein MYU51_020425 [Penicillium brevicompactum]